MLQETFCCGDVLLRRRFVQRRFVEETFCVETFCMCAADLHPHYTFLPLWKIYILFSTYSR
jgi:hypothetical protein